VSPPLQTRALLLHTNASVTSSLAVRRAINLALNRNSISAALGGLEAPADRLFAPDTPFCGGNIGPTPSFDLAGAADLLAADGWTFPAPNFPYRSRDGVALSAELLYIDGDAGASAVVPFIVDQLAEVGFEADPVPLAKAAYQTRMFAGDFVLSVTETLGDPYDPTSYAASWRVPRSYEFPALAGMGAGSNVTFEQLDGMIGAALSELDPTRATAAWTAILTAVNLDAAFAPLTYMTTRAVARPGLVGLALGPQQFDMPLGGLGFPATSGGPRRGAPAAGASAWGAIIASIGAACLALIVAGPRV
jgi:nickel transport system substrate-binding protein